MVTAQEAARHVVVPGDCLEILATFGDCTVDSIVTDPPYGLGFMGKAWDDLPPGLDFAREALRVLKPGGHLLAFGGTRTWHRLAVAVEDAGFEIRDSIAWLYGSGFPKSLDVSKAIDKAAGAEREVTGRRTDGRYAYEFSEAASRSGGIMGEGAAQASRGVITAPATPEAEQWQGWGTALKPAFEPIVVGRKPLAAGTVAANVLAHGTGALNIDGCRIAGESRPVMVRTQTTVKARSMSGESTGATASGEMTTAGRWPANVVLDENQAAALDEQSGVRAAGRRPGNSAKAPKFNGSTYANGQIYDGRIDAPPETLDSGGASRFFYVAKAPKRERPVVDGVAHPTVKPLALMRWLVRLVTPPGGLVLDPFAGSGTTLEAAVLEGFSAVGVEREPDYLKLIEARMAPTDPPAQDTEEIPA